MKKIKNLTTDQTGLAAITVTIIMLSVLALVVLAFSQLSRREQRQSLDRQLSSQAFYAAESGINDAEKYIRSNQAIKSKVDCKAAPQFMTNLDQDNSFQETCVLFDREPSSLEYSKVDGYGGEMISLSTLSNTPSSIKIEWNGTKGVNDYSGCKAPSEVGVLPKKSTNDSTETYSAQCSAGMLRLLFMPQESSTTITRDNLIRDSFTVFVRPVNGSGTAEIPYQFYSGGADNQGAIIPAVCIPNGNCSITIKDMPIVSNMFLRVSSLYNDSAVKITGTDPGNVQAKFDEAQAIIDSTGRASDVVKRIQVRVPIKSQYATPPYVLESMAGICKRLNVYTGYANNSECRTDSDPTGLN